MTGEPEPDDFTAMVERCLAAGTVVLQHGTPEMQAAMRVLLFEVGLEVARRGEDEACVTEG